VERHLDEEIDLVRSGREQLQRLALAERTIAARAFVSASTSTRRNG
jgi:hypothetical protein